MITLTKDEYNVMLGLYNKLADTPGYTHYTCEYDIELALKLACKEIAKLRSSKQYCYAIFYQLTQDSEKELLEITFNEKTAKNHILKGVMYSYEQFKIIEG